MDKHAATFPCTRGTLTVCISILQEQSQHSVAFFMRKSGVDTRLITTTFHLFSFQDYNDEIRQEQLRELSYLNGSEDSGRGRGIRGRGTRIAPTAPSRGRGGAIPPPPPPGRGVLTPRGTTVTRGALPVPPVARGVPTPRARGSPTVPGYRAPPPPAHEGYEEYTSYLQTSPARTELEGIREPFVCGGCDNHVEGDDLKHAAQSPGARGPPSEAGPQRLSKLAARELCAGQLTA
ncbi:hypothetical protein CB1_001024005 [Camelus ferus]|nr:hypothetical protein CB1_001024005 [Camelus ferus]